MAYSKPNSSLENQGVMKYELGDLCTFTQGVQIASSDTINTPEEGYIRYIYIRDLFTDKYPVYVKDEYPNKVLSPTDIVMVNTGNTSGNVYRGKPGVLCNNAFRIATKKENLDQEFLWFCLNSEEKERMLKRFANPSGQPHVGHKNIAKLKVPLFPLSEQQKIAKILTTWDKAINTTERLIENSKQQKKALMQQLLTSQKRLLDDSGQRFSGSWEEVQLGDLAFIDKKSLGRNTPDDFEFNYISLSDVSKGVIANSSETFVYASAPSRARRLISENDILLSTVRPNLQGFAKARAKHKGYVASTGFSVITAKKQVSSDFIYHYVFGEHITRQIYALVVGSNYPAINSSEVSKLKVLKPSFEEQQKIAAVLNNADREIEVLEQQLADLQQEKKALMQQLLTGKKRVLVNEEVA